MKIGLVGLGKMGYNLALNAIDKKHEVVAFDLSENVRAMAEKDGIGTVADLKKSRQFFASPSGNLADGTGR